VELITETLPQPHALLASVCLSQYAKGLANARDRSQWGSFQHYVFKSWFIHAQKSRDDPLFRTRIAEFAQRCHLFPFPIAFFRSFDVLLGPLHLLAYFNLPIVLAGLGHLKEPNIRAPTAMTTRTVNGDSASVKIMSGGTGGLQVHRSFPITSEGTTALWLACEQGSDVAVKELLHLPNILVNKTGWGGMTPLICAVKHGHQGAVRLLLGHQDIKVNAVDSGRRTPLGWAVEKGDAGMVKLLLSHPDIDINMADGCNTPLHHALQKDCKDLFSLLFARPDLNVNAMTSFHSGTTLYAASIEGNEELVTLLLSHPKVDVNKASGWGVWGHQPALSGAAQHGKEGVVRLLLAEASIQINKQDAEGWAPLSLAVGLGWEGVVRLLLAEPSIWVGSREVEAAKSGTGIDSFDEKTGSARAVVLPLLEEFLRRRSLSGAA
jgi:ankyrin repeat protein